MTPYANHTTSALKSQLDDIKKLRILVNEMKKPDNFTYIDVLNLHNHLMELQQCIEIELKERSA